MNLAILLFALSGLFTNERVAVYDGADAAPRAHDSVVVDLKTRTAKFIPQGKPIDAADRAVVIELLAPPIGRLPNPDNLRDAFDRPGIERLFENDRVAVYRFTWIKGQRTPMHFHTRDTVVVFTADGTLASITPDGKSELKPHTFGMTKFSPKGRIHQEELVKGEASAVQVELK